MPHQDQFLAALSEALAMALRALTTNVPKEEIELTAAVIAYRKAQVDREVKKAAA